MGLFNFLDPILNAVFGPLISFNPTIGLIVIVLLISSLITFVYKLMTNQGLMRDLKNEINELQKETKKLKNNPDKALKVQNEMMDINMKYMMQSMKSTFVTFIPIIIMFGWLSSNLAYLPISPGNEFEVEVFLKNSEISSVSLAVPQQMEIIGEQTKEVVKKKAHWQIKAPSEGTYVLTFNVNDESVMKKVLVTNRKEYLKPTMRKKGFTDFIYESTDEYLQKDSAISQIQIGNEAFKANLILFKFGWLGTYIIFSIIFSMLLRKILKIY